jgi:tetratricopeptide (TPR) repeat protein
MNSNIFRQLAIVVVCLVMLPSANAQEQTLFGKKFPTYSQAKRDESWEVLRELRTSRARILYGDANGLLTLELQNQVQKYMYKPEAPEMEHAAEEWLEHYPHIPSVDQRWLSRHALFIARETRAPYVRPPRMGCEYPPKNLPRDPGKPPAFTTKMISSVLDAALAGHWLPYPDLTEELKLVAEDKSLDGALREKAKTVLAQKSPESESNYDSMISVTEELADSALNHAHKQVKKMFAKPCSWWGKFESAITNADGTLKEAVAGLQYPIQEITIESDKLESLRQDLDSLARMWDRLSSESKELFAARTLKITGELQDSNAHVEADRLFWKVFDSIDPTWLDENQVEYQLSLNQSCYRRQNELAKNLKIQLKCIEMRDEQNGGIPWDSNQRYVLGDMYDLIGKYAESKQQYEIARRIDERQVRTCILEANHFMDRDYEMRMGTYTGEYADLVSGKVDTKGNSIPQPATKNATIIER